MSTCRTKNKAEAAIQTPRISCMLGHAFLAKTRAAGFAPNRPWNRSRTSVPITSGMRKRQYTDRDAQATNPQKIAARRWLRRSPASRVKRPYAATKRTAQGRTKVREANESSTAVRGERGQ